MVLHPFDVPTNTIIKVNGEVIRCVSAVDTHACVVRHYKQVDGVPVIEDGDLMFLETRGAITIEIPEPSYGL